MNSPQRLPISKLIEARISYYENGTVEAFVRGTIPNGTVVLDRSGPFKDRESVVDWLVAQGVNRVKAVYMDTVFYDSPDPEKMTPVTGKKSKISREDAFEIITGEDPDNIPNGWDAKAEIEKY